MSLKTENSRRVAESRPVCMGLNTLQNLHTIRAGTNHRDNLQLWGPLQ
jgi:hypothetical protein